MKRHILLLVFLGMAIGFQLNAQTLKNIHRHSQPVLHIPTHLIDKVETAEVNGERVLKVIQLNGYVSQIPVSQIDSITHSEGQAVDPAQLGNLRTASVMGVVSGPTGAPEMNAIVRSPYGGEETHTDPNGVFFLNNILVYDKLGYITITKPGFHQGSRSFLPLETGSNRVNVQLLTMTQSGSFSSSTGGTITSGLLQLSFPANAIVRNNGQPYTGTVNVYAAALDPTSSTTLDQMPGELLGGKNDSLRLLRSFGMAKIELRDFSMNELHLANGITATLTFSIPLALQAEAPETIDWWSFDEVQGFWKHEGEAQKQGTEYVGLASHFSWWNCDKSVNFNNFHGTFNTSDGSPISNAKAEIISPTFGSAFSYTNNDGELSGRVPQNQTLTLNISLFCTILNDWSIAYSDSIVSESDSISENYTVSQNNLYSITGILLNCQGQPVTSGYVRMGNQIYNTENGEFILQTCQPGVYTFRGFDIFNPDSLKVSQLVSIQVSTSEASAGTIPTCSTISGTVTDIDGNVYETALIGEQWWMAENLKTSHFAEGTEIPQVQDSLTWKNLFYSSWCYYNNNQSLGETYGKLYNWYTTVDNRNVCPIGWHVPDSEDWNELSNFLGGIYIAGAKLKSATVGWEYPNISTNESEFSALPGGYRASLDAGFENLLLHGSWWSSTQSNASTALGYVLLHHSSLLGYSPDFGKNSGYSIRCIKD